MPVISNRLTMLADLLPETDTLADVGADHAMLLTSLVLSGKIRRGIGIEIAAGPYDRAIVNVQALGLQADVEIRLGDGLKPLVPGEATACAIAGMGGKTITDILAACPDTAESFSYLLLQPMKGEKEVRTYLWRNGWRICKEALVEEKDILYQIILAERGEMAPLSPAEAAFGPLLLAEKPPLLYKAVREKIRRLYAIVKQIEQAGSETGWNKSTRFKEQIEEWEKLLP